MVLRGTTYQPDFADYPSGSEEWVRGGLQGDESPPDRLPYVNDLQVLVWATETGPRLAPPEFTLLVAMSKLYRHNQEWLTISQAQLADMANFPSQDKVCKVMRKLKALDMVQIKAVYKDNLRQHSQYRLAGFLTGWRPFDKTDATQDPFLDRLEEAKDEINRLRHLLASYESDMPAQHREEEDPSLVTTIEELPIEEEGTPVMPNQHNGESEEQDWVWRALVANPTLFEKFNGGFNAAYAYFSRKPLELSSRMAGLEQDQKAREESEEDTKPGRGRRKRTTEVNEEYIEKMVGEFPTLDVRDEIAQAMDHKSANNYTDMQRYVRNWLKRSLDWQKQREARGGQGRSLHERRIEAEKRIPIKPPRRV